VPLLRHPLSAALAVEFDSELVDLMQRYLDVELLIKKAPRLNEQERELLIQKVAVQAHEIMSLLLNKQGGTADSRWVDFYIGKLAVLCRGMMVRMYTLKQLHSNEAVQEVYFKHMVLVKDPLFNELASRSTVRGYASRYENVVMRFLSNQIGVELDFYAEQYALIEHLKALLTKSTPTGWTKHWMPLQGLGIYIDTFKSMIAILEIIGKTFKPDNGAWAAAAKNIVSSLVAGDAKVQNVNMDGLSQAQIMAILQSGSGKEIVANIVAQVGPQVVQAVLSRWNNKADVSASAPISAPSFATSAAAA
jgi:hypothetical protein